MNSAGRTPGACSAEPPHHHFEPWANVCTCRRNIRFPSDVNAAMRGQWDALVAERDQLKAELDETKAAVQATLELADRLNGYAEGGAGFHPHWGVRVIQAVEPLRNVSAFRDQTLEHNRMLLESNSEFIRRFEAAESSNAALSEALRRFQDEVNESQACSGADGAWRCHNCDECMFDAALPRHGHPDCPVQRLVVDMELALRAALSKASGT